MPIFNHQILITTETVSHTSYDNASQQIGQVMVNEFFEKLNQILTADGFTRVDKNTLNYSSTQQNYYRETYKYGNNTSKYLIVEYVPSYSIGYSYTDVFSRFYISSEIKKSSSSGISEEFLSEIRTLAVAERHDSVSDEGVESYYINITWGVYLSGIKNDTICLYQFTSNTNKSSLDLLCGIFSINDNVYITYKYSASPTGVSFVVTGNDGAKLFTASRYLASKAGTDDTGYVLTLPIYLCASDDIDAMIYKDLKLENALQTTDAACEFGAVYKIGGVDYFAIANNFLIKL